MPVSADRGEPGAPATLLGDRLPRRLPSDLSELAREDARPRRVDRVRTRRAITEEIEAAALEEAIRRSVGTRPRYQHLTRPALPPPGRADPRFYLGEIHVSRQPDPAGPVDSICSAIETVAHSLDPDWAQHFADRLSGPNGLELVVEVAHDIRSPLTSILFLAETLQRGRSGAINEIQERQLGLIYSAAFGLSAMASDVIELARGGDRLVDLDPIPFCVTDILESVRDIVLPIAEEKGLAVRISPPNSDFRIGHPVALSRVLLNLTTNALKFTDEGHVEVRPGSRPAPGSSSRCRIPDGAFLPRR